MTLKKTCIKFILPYNVRFSATSNEIMENK